MFGLNMSRPLGARGFSTSAVVEKLKTHKGTAKRFSITGTGIYRHAKCGKTHSNTKMSGRTGQSLRGYGYIAKGSRQNKNLQRLMPYL